MSDSPPYAPEGDPEFMPLGPPTTPREYCHALSVLAILLEHGADRGVVADRLRALAEELT